MPRVQFCLAVARLRRVSTLCCPCTRPARVPLFQSIALACSTMFNVCSMVRGCPSARPNIREDLTPFRNVKRRTLLLALAMSIKITCGGLIHGWPSRRAVSACFSALIAC